MKPAPLIHTGKGTFHLAFSPAEGSTDYILPSPFFYELKSVGTTMLTVNLSKNQALTQSTGITEIEVLDENNHPVEGIELYVDSEKNSPQHPEPTPSADVLHSASSKNPEPSGNPDRFFSVTNEEGIAVFKLPSGIYNVKFSPDKLPKDYKPRNFLKSIVLPILQQDIQYVWLNLPGN